MTDLSFYNKTNRPWLNARLTNAAIIGHTTTTSAKLWVRAWEEDRDGEPTDGAGPYWLVVCDQRIDGLSGQPQVITETGGTRVVIQADGTATPLPGIVQLHALQLRFETDLTGTVELTGLEPNTRYHYALFAGFERSQRWELGNDQDLFFRTQPEQPQRVTFGVFSCHQPFTRFGVRKVEMFSALREELDHLGGDYLLAIGDQIYADGYKQADIWEWLNKVQDEPNLKREDMVSWYRDVYRGFWGFNGLKELLARYPTYMVLDDHEIADGWGSLDREQIAKRKLGLGAFLKPKRALQLVDDMFKAAMLVYEEYQHAHNPATAKGVYDYGFQNGFVSTYVLDMRTAHGLDQTPGQVLLGLDQFQRLRAWLAAVPEHTKVVFVVSPVPVVHFSAGFVNSQAIAKLPFVGASDDLLDEWEHATNLAERSKLLELVSEFSEKHGIPVMFLSGDVHMSAAFELWDTKRPTANVFQLTTSGITYNGPARVPDIGHLDQGVTHKDGLLAGTNETWILHRLQTDPHHNFAIVSCKLDTEAGVTVSWSVYVPGEDESSVARLKRLDIYPPSRAR